MKEFFVRSSFNEATVLSDLIFTSAYFSPRHRDEAEPGHLPSSGLRAEAQPHALVVDDAPDVLEMLAILLRHEGYDVMTAASAPDALKAAQAEQFDVIVSDIGMPGMDGYSLAAALRSLPAYSKVPLVAVTGFALFDDRERAINSGFDAHLTKPINPITLLELLARLREQG